MNRDQVIAAIVVHENEFDAQMGRAAYHARDGICFAPQIHDHAISIAAKSASILAELRHRLAIMEGKS